MCGRFGISRPDQLRLERLGLSATAIEPRYNISPGEDIFVIVGGGAPVLRQARWGVTGSRASPYVNLRSERFRTSAGTGREYSRVLVPADVFYEWQVRVGQRQKIPFAVARPDRVSFMLGGVGRDRPGEGAEVAILTREPNQVLRPIHDRMPVIVPDKDWRSWLSPSLPNDEVGAIIDAGAELPLEVWPVSTRLNRGDEDDAGLLDRVAPSGPTVVLDMFSRPSGEDVG